MGSMADVNILHPGSFSGRAENKLVPAGGMSYLQSATTFPGGVMSADLVKEFITQSTQRIDESTARITQCIHELTEDEIWKRPNASSNSAGNILLHLAGNIGQYAVSSLGDKADTRERPLEFSATGGMTGTELLGRLTATVTEALSIIRRQDENGLLKVRSVQGFTLSGMGIIIHVTEHYSYHAGQIAFWTKILKNKDLGFYTGVDLNANNEQ